MKLKLSLKILLRKATPRCVQMCYAYFQCCIKRIVMLMLMSDIGDFCGD